MFASVVIPTRNRRALVRSAVDALLQQDYPQAQYEIIVACDRCEDGTETELREKFGGRVRVLQAERPGPSGAINTALDHARGEIAIIMDDEVRASPRLISEYVLEHQRVGPDKAVIIGYLSIEVPAGSHRVLNDLADSYDEFFDELRQGRRESLPGDLSGSNFSIRADHLRSAGGYSADYPVLRNDLELGIRLVRDGFKFHFAPAAAGTATLDLDAAALIRRAHPWGQTDLRLARQYPWCAQHLAFSKVLRKRRSRFLWRLLWIAGKPAVGMVATLRRCFPRSVWLTRWEFAGRYALGIREQVPGWRGLDDLIDGRWT